MRTVSGGEKRCYICNVFSRCLKPFSRPDMYGILSTAETVLTWPEIMEKIIPGWESNHMPIKELNEITCPFSNFNNSLTVEIWEWIRNFIQQLIMDAITSTCWHWSQTMSVNRAHGMISFTFNSQPLRHVGVILIFKHTKLYWLRRKKLSWCKNLFPWSIISPYTSRLWQGKAWQQAITCINAV